jgi:hypothetical protein
MKHYFKSGIMGKEMSAFYAVFRFWHFWFTRDLPFLTIICLFLCFTNEGINKRHGLIHFYLHARKCRVQCAMKIIFTLCYASLSDARMKCPMWSAEDPSRLEFKVLHKSDLVLPLAVVDIQCFDHHTALWQVYNAWY